MARPFRKDFLQALAVDRKLRACIFCHLLCDFKPIYGHGPRILHDPASANVIDPQEASFPPFRKERERMGTPASKEVETREKWGTLPVFPDDSF